jgi:hypothetical protein
VVAAVASSRIPSLIQAAAARAVSPVAAASPVEDRRKPPVPTPVSCAVAFAPAAMSALLEAQEGIARTPPPLARATTVGWIDHLISTLDDAPAQAVDAERAPLEVRRLETARVQLARVGIDVQA